MDIAAVVLAAGASRRFGSDKRLHLVDGQPMLAVTLATYRLVFSEVGVVIRPSEPVIATLVREAECRVVEAEDAAAGQSRSLAAGVQAMRHADALVVGLGDMPFVAPQTLRRLAEALEACPGRIVRPTCQGRPGNPIGFPASMFDRLESLAGDMGARQLLADNRSVALLPVDDPGIHLDVDRPV